MARFEDLPKDIIPEILSKLPAESVLDCKLVCKPWRDLIHLPSFTQKHLNHHINSAGDDCGKLNFVFLYRVILNYDEIIGKCTQRDEFSYAEYDEDSQETPFSRKSRLNVNLPFYKCGYDYSLAGSCNGLICLDSFHKDIYGPTYIFNPITREYIMLPTSQGSYYWSGFGYIPSTNEYKVVRIYADTIVKVYTLGSSTGWRYVGKMDNKMDTWQIRRGEFANGALHWADEEGTILAFHLTDEKFRELPSPPWFTRSSFPDDPIRLGILGDCLSATYRGRELWLLKKNKDNDDLSWSEVFSFEDVCILRDSSPFGFTKAGRLLCYDYCKIYGYDPKASTGKMVGRFGNYRITAAIPHKNTLLSLKLLGEKDAKTMELGE